MVPCFEQLYRVLLLALTRHGYDKFVVLYLRKAVDLLQGLIGILTQVLLDALVLDEYFWVGASHDAGIAYAFLGLEEFSVVVDDELLAVGADEEVGVLLGHLGELNRVLLDGLVLL